MNSSDDQEDCYSQRVVDALPLLDVVYGQVGSAEFPLPLESYEAGPCINGQRRYLWTDAFAVMAYQTLAEHFAFYEQISQANLYHGAVERLIAVVHDSLGRPRSNRKSDKMMECDISPWGYSGLRIGKPTAKKVTDPATRYDGQFWHHIDKWLLALVRAGHIDEGVRIAKSCFPSFFCEPIAHPYGYSHTRGGMRYKLSVDGTIAPPDKYGRCGEFGFGDSYDDTLNAYVVFSMLEAKNQNKDEISLHLEIIKLQNVLLSFGGGDLLNQPNLRGERDPMWWGMEAIFDQFVVGHPRTTDFHFRMRLSGLGTAQLHHSRRWLAYAELMGASVDETVLTEHTLEELLTVWVYRQPVMYQFMGGHPQDDDRKAGMERVMLAMALLSPGVLKRRSDDVMVQI